MSKFRSWTSASVSAALLVLAAGVLTSSASSPGASAFVPITPCRLLDTRPGSDNVGSRSTPLAAGETFTTTAWGANGKCTLPSGITGLSMNVAIVAPTGDSYLTVWPADKDRPLAASLNWVARQAPTPNAVSTALSVDGKLSFYSPTGTVHLAVDVVGYYEPTAGGPTGPAGATGPAGPRGISAWDTIPSGVTVTGMVLFDTSSTGDVSNDTVYIPLPGVAPADPVAVNFAQDYTASTVDDDVLCTGTYSSPTAPSGRICVYRFTSAHMSGVSASPSSYDSRHGFAVNFTPQAGVADMYLNATWAYTAP